MSCNERGKSASFYFNTICREKEMIELLLVIKKNFWFTLCDFIALVLVSKNIKDFFLETSKPQLITSHVK